MSWLVLLPLLVGLPQVEDDPQDTTTDLVQFAIGEDATLAEDARERLIQRLSGDLRETLRTLGPQPVMARQQLYDLIGAAEAQLRWDLASAQLPEQHRKAADRLLRSNPRTARALFSRGSDDRIAALGNLPNDKAVPVVLMLADDPDSYVSFAALERAAELKDRELGLGLWLRLQELEKLIQDGFFRDKQPAIQIVVGQYAHKLIVALGACECREALPSILAVTKHYAGVFDTHMWSLPKIFDAVAQLKDPDAAELMLPFLQNPGLLLRTGRSADGVRISRHMSDAALEALLHLFDQPHADYGLLSATGRAFLGFPGENERQQAVGKFRNWYEARKRQEP